MVSEDQLSLNKRMLLLYSQMTKKIYCATGAGAIRRELFNGQIFEVTKRKGD